MGRATGRTSWFATLRRDARLFVLLAVALLGIQALQPLAAAQASEATDHLVICTALAADDGAGDTRLVHEGCGDCIPGACGTAPVGKSTGGWVAAWLAPRQAASIFVPTTEDAAPAPVAPSRPLGSRAPPFAA